MRGGRIVVSSCAVAALAALCAGCGDDADDRAEQRVTFGHAPAPSGRIPVPATGHRMLNGAHWPDACRFLTDAEIRAILPETEKVARRPVQVTANLDGRSHPRNPARAGECLMDVSLSGGTVGKALAVIKVRIKAVGGPRPIAKRYAKEKGHPAKATGTRVLGDYGSRLGPGGCFAPMAPADGALTCRQGPLLYRVSGTCYCDVGARPDNAITREGVWITKVLGPAAKTIAAKIA